MKNTEYVNLGLRLDKQFIAEIDQAVQRFNNENGLRLSRTAFIIKIVRDYLKNQKTQESE